MVPTDDLKQFWGHLDTLRRDEVIRLAKEEILDIRGLSAVQKVLYKYNLSTFTMDHDLNISLKRKIKGAGSPRQILYREQREGI